MTRSTLETYFVRKLCHNVYGKKNWAVLNSIFSLSITYFEWNGTHFNKNILCPYLVQET